MCLVDLIIAVTWLDHLPIMTYILVGNVVESKPSSLLRLNVSHLNFENFKDLVYSVWNLVPLPRWDKGWILWWEESILYTVKFIKGWGHMIVRKCRREL